MGVISTHVYAHHTHRCRFAGGGNNYAHPPPPSFEYISLICPRACCEWLLMVIVAILFMENPYILFTSGIQSQANFSEESEMFSFTLYLLVCHFCTADCILRRILYPTDLHRAEVEPHFHKKFSILRLFKMETFKTCMNILLPWLFALIFFIWLCFLFTFTFFPTNNNIWAHFICIKLFSPRPQAVWWIDYSFFATFVDCYSRFRGQFHLCKTQCPRHRLLLIFSHKAIMARKYGKVTYACDSVSSQMLHTKGFRFSANHNSGLLLTLLH